MKINIFEAKFDYFDLKDWESETGFVKIYYGDYEICKFAVEREPYSLDEFLSEKLSDLFKLIGGQD